MLALVLSFFLIAPNFLLAQDQVFYAGCREADFQLIELDVVEVKTQGMKFVPKCLRVRQGATVILPGSKNHPLQGSAEINEVFNPFIGLEAQESSQERTLNDLGQIAFHCEKHADPETGAGMAGLIEVIE